MIRQCLICDSRAVLPQEVARGIALLAGLAAIAPTYPSALRLAEDVAKYHFAGFDCLCLRCGALFDEAVKEASEQAPQPT
ncbi:hypothetical protein DYL61_28870 [Pseudomonas nabeulensis]|uniref:Uncharacterized protein n=1 Tax=Pseudomonas nabeulensis TaxID=2293833 RepID=A0A4Z0AHM9_9PSED|nr:hypothetical protein [Pseudomonas nabeulensis]TFY85907.1 hypothetical protein DYL61_28870 [Pseudomonas nabeulensis]